LLHYDTNDGLIPEHAQTQGQLAWCSVTVP
jgi:hypothetical protein